MPGIVQQIPDLRSADAQQSAEQLSGQLVRVLRAEYLVDAVGFNRVRGVPLATQDIVETINQLLEGTR